MRLSLARRAGETRRNSTSPDRGASDLLNYQAMVGDGVVVLKDEQGGLSGPLLAGYYYEGPDFESVRAEVKEQLTVTVNRGLRRLGAGVMLHCECIVREAEGYLEDGAFEEPVDRAIDLERRARSAHFETSYALFITQAPEAVEQSPALNRARQFFLGETPSATRQSLEARVARFEQFLTELEGTLSRGLHLRRMRYSPDNDALLQALQYVVNGVLKRCRLPAEPSHLDVLLAHRLVCTPDEFTYGESHVAVVGVLDLPAASTPGMLHSLRQLGFEFRWSTRFILFDYRGGRSRLSSLRDLWQQKQTSLSSKVVGTESAVDGNAVARTHEANEALADNEDGAVRFGHYTTVVVVRGGTRAEADGRARLVAKALEEQGFEPRIEKMNALEALLGSLPGHGVQNVRKPIVNTLNLADLMPTSTEWKGSRVSPCPFYEPSSPALMQVLSWSGAAFYLNLHVADVGHTLVIGPTGAGKSTLLGTLCTQFLRYPSAQVFVCDKGESMLPLTLARSDGAHYALGGDQSPQLCPLAKIDTDGDRAWASEWLEGLCEEQGLTLFPSQRTALYDAVLELAESTDEPASRTLTHLWAHVQDPALREALRYYTTGVGGTILNGDSDRIAHARFTTFELQHLLAAGRDRVATPTLLYLFREIEKRLDGRPTLLVIDEAWLQLSHPKFADKLKVWLKTLRKTNCAVVMATQSLADIMASPIASTVLESCPTRILLPNAQAGSESMRALYAERLQLNPGQIAAIAEAPPKGWYLLAQGEKSRLFTMNLGPVAMSFVGATGKEDVAAVRALQAEHGPMWPAAWLERRGQHQAAARLMSELRLGTADRGAAWAAE